MAELERVVVVGGGIGGLTAALGLQRAGVQVEVHEKYDHLAKRASAFTLWSYAIARLIELGLSDLSQVGAPLEFTEIRDETGRVLEELPVGEVSRKLGADSYEIDRRGLRALLLEALDEDVLRMPSECVGVEQRDGSAVALLDGSEAGGDLVIGADGAHSVTRAVVAPGASPSYAGYAAWAGVLEDFDHELFAQNRHVEVWARGAIGGVADLGHGRARWYVGLETDPDVGWGHVDKAHLVDTTAGWYPLIRDAVAAADADSITAMEAWELDPLDTWIAGRLVLLGDAAHLTTPSISGGACTTIEDSAALVRGLSGPLELDQALRSFEAERKRRDERMVRRSRGIGRLQHLHSPASCWLRDHAFEHVPARQARRITERIAAGR
ncbi:MAG: FAD-dependent monooxygenase [Solirubrobacterales bacterium]